MLAVALGFFNSKLFTAVAFDSGGVATGAMAVSFTLPMVIGLSAEGASGFGTIALIAAFPILSMQILGFIYKLVLIKAEKELVKSKVKRFEIVEFDWDNTQLSKTKKTTKKVTVKKENVKGGIR